MITMSREAAIKWSLELAKTICSTQGNGIQIDKIGAKDLADFIEDLQNRFTKDVPD